MRPQFQPIKGDTVIFTERNGTYRTGIVDTAVNWGSVSDPDWYVEGHYNSRKDSYFYMKQRVDKVQWVQFRNYESASQVFKTVIPEVL